MTKRILALAVVVTPLVFLTARVSATRTTDPCKPQQGQTQKTDKCQPPVKPCKYNPQLPDSHKLCVPPVEQPEEPTTTPAPTPSSVPTPEVKEKVLETSPTAVEEVETETEYTSTGYGK